MQTEGEKEKNMKDKRKKFKKEKKKAPLRYKREVMYFHQVMARNSLPGPFINRSTMCVWLKSNPRCRLPNQ